ncbi:MAG: helix-turn-helix domain-containing protein [Clostridia bacterium]|nr:helix-turn-helix domain-containing protein [Clostridia bacterium]
MALDGSAFTSHITKAILDDVPVCQAVTAFEAVYTPGNFPKQMYSHNIVEIGIVLSGEGTHLILEQAIPCQSGDAFVIGSDVEHGYFSQNTGESLVVHRLWFDPADWFDGTVANEEGLRYCYGVFEDGLNVGCAVLTQRSRSQLLDLCARITEEITGQKQEWHEAVKAHLSLLLILLGRYVGESVKNISYVRSKDWRLVTGTIEIIEAEFADNDLTLGSIADRLFVSKAHLSRLFKRLTGEMFSDYLRKVRYSHACKLLTETVLPISEISHRCGFKDLSSFRRVFSASEGMTPSDYRKSRIQLSNNKNTNEKKEPIMSTIAAISENVQKGKAKIVQELVKTAIDEGADIQKILNEGLLDGMSVVGENFKVNKVHVPEVLVAARAMNMGVQILKPHLVQAGVEATGKVCIGTVQGDLHDIGKNLVKMMMEGKGLEVVDLGTDVSPETFVQTAIDQNCQIICCSALLTTTMGVMEEVVKLAEEKGIRDKVKIMVGGAPVNEDFCKNIGADVYTSDAASAADAALAICQNN